MRRLFRATLVLTLIFLVSCTKKPNQAHTSPPDSASKIVNKSSTDRATIEDALAESDNVVSIVDTLFQEFGIRVTIVEKALDTFVISESYSIDQNTGEKVKHSLEVKDIERRLRISRKDEVLVDTVLRKQDFKHVFDEGFMDTFTFGRYELEEVNAEKVKFLGVIGEPYTDFMVVAFNHHFDFRTRTFSIEILDFEEEEDEDEDEDEKPTAHNTVYAPYRAFALKTNYLTSFQRLDPCDRSGWSGLAIHGDGFSKPS